MRGDSKHLANSCFAYLVNPGVYDLEAAIEHLSTGKWPTTGRDVAIGDRVMFWRTLTHTYPRDLRRGVIALGEVVGVPEFVRDTDPFWVIPPSEAPEWRAEIRYVRPPGLPLWLGGPADRILNDLTVKNGQGTKLYHVTEAQWIALVDDRGGRGLTLHVDQSGGQVNGARQ